ncbi:MAG: hypothetical protein PHV61_09665 [Limnochordia bacterium]|jgi:hypothetical protein|nr:hypothetical protein [Limnochordia bacterium]
MKRDHPKARKRAVFYDSIEDVKKVNIQAFADDILATYSPTKTLVISGFLAGIIIMILPVIFIALYGLLRIGIELIGDTVQWQIREYRIQTINSILAYLKNTWWLALLVGGFGVALAFLRRQSGLKHAFFYPTFDYRGGPVKMGYDTITAAIVVPIVTMIAVFLIGIGDIGIILIPLWIISGLLFYWLWRYFDNRLLRKLGEECKDREMEWGLRDVFRQEGLLKNSKIEILYDCETCTATLTGSVPNKYTREKMRQICLGQGQIKRVDIEELTIVNEVEETTLNHGSVEC